MTTFKVGQRVRFVQSNTWVRNLVGQTGTVRKYDGRYAWVEFDKPTLPMPSNGKMWPCPEISLALAELTPLEQDIHDYIAEEMSALHS